MLYVTGARRKRNLKRKKAGKNNEIKPMKEGQVKEASAIKEPEFEPCYYRYARGNYSRGKVRGVTQREGSKICNFITTDQL